jgi:hypothetical protein
MSRIPALASSTFALTLLALSACSGGNVECRAELDAWEDLDGDGHGDSKRALGKVCELEEGMSESPLDCDDTDPDVAPEARERCNGIDDDCDGDRDETFERELYYEDLDGDGFGGFLQAVLVCDPPPGAWVSNKRDCNDADKDINPDAQEVCGGGDEDCDGLPDDADDSVDPSTFETFYRDSDGDGYGDNDFSGERCDLPQGASDNGNDCDDTDPLVGRLYWYADTDGDGFGDPNVIDNSCRRPAGFVPDNTDCDDTDALANVDKEWYDDLDGDGFGGGAVVSISCRTPFVGLVPDDSDCDDTDDGVNPGIDDACFDGIDINCDGSDNCRTCAEWLETDPDSPSGTYTLDLRSGARQVYCDMDVDGGGWTLVSNSRYIYDYSSAYFNELQSLTNNNYWYSRGIWDGLREVISEDSDVRVACGFNGSNDFQVDLSFYDIHWYREWTTSTIDGDSCFNEPGGYDQPAPARRNNETGDERPLGDDWDSGSLRGEDSCNDYGDFAIDFDNRGKAAGAYAGWGAGDATSWGAADYNFRCGSLTYGANFWVFVREP